MELPRVVTTTLPGQAGFEMLGGADQKALFDYWHDRVLLKNHGRIGAREHVTTQELRHECTNYDELRRLQAVLDLDELERCRVIAIIKYECTARVLQRRTGLLREYADSCRDNALAQGKERSRLGALLFRLKEALRGKQVEIDRLTARIEVLEAENAALRSEQQRSKAELQLQKELQALRRAYEAEVERRRQLARNNQSLGGRLAHTNRYRRERDELRRELEQLRSGDPPQPGPSR